MKEGRLNTEMAPPKKEPRDLEELQTQGHPSTWRGGVLEESVKSQAVRPGHSWPDRRRPDKWNPPSTLFAG